MKPQPSTYPIILVIATLGAGGAERVMAMLANEWVRRRHPVTLITLGPITADHYTLDPAVHRIGLDVLGNSRGKFDALRRNYRRLAALRQAIRQTHPRAVISFMDSTNILTLLATRGLRLPVIVSERIDPRHYPIARGWQWLRRQLYPRAHAVVVQTSAVSGWARSFLSEDRVVVIPNPIEIPPRDPAALPPDFPAPGYILAVGRLDRQKGFDLLIRAYATLPGEAPPLLIIGEGPERPVLEAQLRELHLESRVYLPGRLASPASAYGRAGLFVLSSRFEGFPNVLLEAMAAGLPVIATDCPSGPGEILQSEHNGLLVPPNDAPMLAAAMSRLLGDTALQKRLGEQALHVIENYSLAAITDQWERLLPEFP